MASKHFLRFSAIVEFFKDEPKLVSRGENAVDSNHVKDMAFDNDLMVIRGNIHASMKDKVYKVELHLDSEKDIDQATCTCPRGQLICHHMAALAIFAYHNISATDASCTWNVRKTKNEGVHTISDLFPTRPHTSTSQTISDEQLNSFKSKLYGFNNAVGFTWLLRAEPNPSTNDVVDIEQILFSREYMAVSNKKEYFERATKLMWQKIIDIAKKSTGQFKNELWLVARKNRLTASNFSFVLSAVKNNRYPPSLFSKLTESYTLDGVKAIQWGREHESDGVRVLEMNRHIKVEATGIWLHECGYLGGSPDGLVNDDGIVEVKCPYKHRESKSLLNSLGDKKYILYRNESGNLVLNRSHSYYDQIQGNLYLTKRKICYLVIWTPEESVIYDVIRDEEWHSKINLLKEFYISKYLPFLCGNK